MLFRSLAEGGDSALDAGTALDMATILLLKHRFTEGLALQNEVLDGQRLFSLRSNPDQARVRVLVLVTAGDLMANTPIDFLLNDAMYGILFRDINMKRTLVDQHFSRKIIALSRIVIHTGEDNYLTTADAVENGHQVLASQFINERFAENAGMTRKPLASQASITAS